MTNLVTERELWPTNFREAFFHNVIPCGDMHQSFTDTLAKWFFENFPVFADSFCVLSIHCVARGLGASFLYKCPASRASSLWQHGLLVMAAHSRRRRRRSLRAQAEASMPASFNHLTI